MEKDERYKAVRRLIEKADITEFNQMFTFIPKTVVARDLGTSPMRFTEKLKAIERFTFGEIMAIAKLLEVETSAVVKILDNQYKLTRNKRPR